ncbi:Protein anon-37Cs [Trichostrongylus colubriformis]|uniref:Protein anon-37Cs n=1 Tax=Trichostrongylus colubriformis TaxID=6319 RepID=A0AAN8EZN4_TRICO
MTARRPYQMPELPRRVAIIGAGFAGLSAAAVLERTNAIEYVVYEGANRVGGRVYSVPYGMFETYDNYHSYLYKEEVMVTRGGNFGALVKDWLDFVKDIEEQFTTEALDRSEMSVAERFQELYDQWISRDEFKQNKAIFDRLARLYLTYYEIEWSSPANELALLNFVDWDDGGSGPCSFTLKKKGFRDILENIKLKVPEDRIKLNSVVTKLTYSDDGVILSLANGDEHHYDHAIVTCSLGYLKRNHNSFFSPPLDARKAEAISSLGFGNMMKVFLEYTKPWWPEDANAIAPLESHSPLAESFPMLQPLYWNKKILVAWVSGKGPGLISKLSDEELVEGLTDHLRDALGDPTIPLPVRIFRHSWITDPLVGGSYSYLTPDSVKYVPDAFVRMAEPIIIGDKPVVCFAGEHTHATMYQTTIGAYESGEREATRIVEYLSPKNC